MHAIILFAAGLFAGVVNAVAGGGALIAYPLLLSYGLAPITANATTTIIVWPGALSSAYGYRKHIKKLPKRYFWLLLPSLAGGLVGAIILRRTPNTTFKYIVPWFIASAVVLLILQPRIHKWIQNKRRREARRGKRLMILPAIAVMTFIVAIYGGYFGAGFGIIMLALLGSTQLTDIHQMNGLKNLSAVSINVFASIYFIANRMVNWHYVPFMLAGCVIGGLVGSTYSNKLPKTFIHGLVIVIGTIIAVVLFIKL